MIAIDSHTHVYPGCEEVAVLLAGGVRLLRAMESKGCAVLFLCESENQDVFTSKLKVCTERHELIPGGSWQIQKTHEAVSLNMIGPVDEWIVVIRGQQIITSESIEVLAVGHSSTIPHGQTLKSTIDIASDEGSHVILPWGAGKWLSKRGKLVREVLNNFTFQGFHVGDNGGRPSIWPVPHFRIATEKQIKILCGSDPLPIRRDETRIGTYASAFDGTISKEKPWCSLKGILEDPGISPKPLGSLMSVCGFLRSQFLLRTAKTVS